MNFKETEIKGAYEITLEKKGDERGFFARGYCEQEFKDNGIPFNMVQANFGYNKYQNTLRGLHYQIEPHAEKKLVQCVKGAVYDVILDLRPDSPSYRNWVGCKLTVDDNNMLFIPEGCAHGYQTLTDDSQIFYMVSAFYKPEAERGIHWDDSLFNIKWKDAENMIISDKDRNWPEYTL